jgi:hypothetical protein
LDQHQFSDLPDMAWDLLGDPSYVPTYVRLEINFYWLCQVWERLP